MASTEAPRFLLLLPPAPRPQSAADLRTAYGETIKEVLKEVASHSSESLDAAVLEIALACDHLVGAGSSARSALYDQTQHLVAGVYRLVCVIAAEDNVNVEDADGVDVRILLVAWSLEDTTQTVSRSPYGPILDIKTLAKSGRRWQFAFGVETELGGSMVRAFVEAKGQEDDRAHAQSPQGSEESTSKPSVGGDSKHFHVAVGGTFDHLHIGHKLLLTMTIFAVDASHGAEKRSATIGITGDQLLVKKKHAEFVESWADRQKAVAAFVSALIDFSPPGQNAQSETVLRDEPVPNGRSTDIHYPDGLIVKCTEIQDPFGPTITEEQISALIISAETRSGGNAVNQKRKDQGWKELAVFEVDVLDAQTEGDSQKGEAKESFDSKLSSTAIREKLAKKISGKI